MKYILIIIFTLTTFEAKSHLPYLRNLYNNNIFNFVIPGNIEKCVGIYDTYQPTQPLKVVKFTLTNKDFDPNLTINGYNEETNENGETKLLITDSAGVTGRKLRLATYIPGCPQYNELLPLIIVVGPKQEYLNTYNFNILKELNLPIHIDKNEGIFILNNEHQGPLWYEKESRKYYYEQNNASIVLSKPGNYKIYVINPDNYIADYTLIIGFIEVWKPRDILQAAFNLPSLWHNLEIKNKKCRKDIKR